MEKMTDINLLGLIFPKFELVKSIELRENDGKEKYYSLNYELDDGTFAVIAIALKNNKPFIINGFHVSKNQKNNGAPHLNGAVCKAPCF